MRFLLLFAAGALGWSAACAGELAWRDALFHGHAGVFDLVLGALPFSAVCTIILTAFDVPADLAQRRWRLPAWIAPALVGLLVAYPAWKQATFLTSGDGIVGSGYLLPLRYGLWLALTSAAGLLWAWHAWGWHAWGQHSIRERLAGAHPAWWRLALWWAAGALALSGLVWALAARLDYYAYFASALIWPIWLLSAGLVHSLFALAGRAGNWSGATLGGAGVLLTLALIDPFGMRLVAAGTPDAGRLPGFANVAVFPPQRPVARLDLSNPAAFSCAEPARPPLSPLPLSHAQRRNVILISVDALREDMLRANVDGRALTPHLRAFADRSLYFSSAQTTYPATVLSMGGALTGLSPAQLLFSAVPPANILATTRPLFDEQFAVLPSNKWFRMPIIDSLFLQGTRTLRQPNDAAATDVFIEQLQQARRQKQRTFAWLHYFSPHDPYRTREGFDFGPGKRQRYMSEVAYFDAACGRLIQYLEQDGWLEDALILVVADHGQALGEAGYWGHHVYLNGWMTDVPLLLHYPGVTPREEPGVVEILDIAPTVHDFLGQAIPADWTGRSLLAAALGNQPEARVAVAEAFPVRGEELFEMTNQPIANLEQLHARLGRLQASAKNYAPKVSIVQGHNRMIVDRDTGAIELYDRLEDRKERRNLADDQPALVASLKDALQRWHARQSERIYCNTRRN